MLSKENFTEEHIREIRAQSGADPSIIEKSIFAFGLLEALQKVEMPFIFKGGTSLMLLLKKPMRLSTDIDIIVEPKTDVEHYVNKAKEIFPFYDVKEDVRIGLNNIEKRHFRFVFESPLKQREVNILLDIVFEHDPYSLVEERKIEGPMLLNEGEKSSVAVPNKNCILGDKLTAFAPHTTGIKFNQDKDLEIVKQFIDCWMLCKEMDDFQLVTETYERFVKIEAGYRGLNITALEVLRDTIETCICFLGRGTIRPEEYACLKTGINGIQGHLFSGRFNGENAGICACEVMCLAACIRAGKKEFTRKDNMDMYNNEKLTLRNAKKIAYIRNIDPRAYGYMVEALRLSPDITID